MGYFGRQFQGYGGSQFNGDAIGGVCGGRLNPTSSTVVVLRCGLVRHGNVGTKDRRQWLAFVLCLLIPLTGGAGCAYEYSEPAHAPITGSAPVYAPTAARTPVPATAKPYSDPLKDPFLPPHLTEGLRSWISDLTVIHVDGGHWRPATHPQEFAHLLLVQ
jgi:hypothetical protein